MAFQEFAYPILRLAHITAGLVTLGAGAGAMIFKKGSPLHRQHGTVFFAAMMTLGATGLWIALFINPIASNQMGAMMALYMASTAWLTMRNQPGTTSRFDVAAAGWGVLTTLTAGTFAALAYMSPTGQYHRFPALGYAIFGAVALLGTAFDFRMLARGGVTGTARTTRHLWRMSLSFFFATASFFFGNARVFPEEIRRTGLLTIPALVPLVLMLYWLVRVRVVPLIRKSWTPRFSFSSD